MYYCYQHCKKRIEIKGLKQVIAYSKMLFRQYTKTWVSHGNYEGLYATKQNLCDNLKAMTIFMKFMYFACGLIFAAKNCWQVLAFTAFYIKYFTDMTLLCRDVFMEWKKYQRIYVDFSKCIADIFFVGPYRLIKLDCYVMSKCFDDK